MQIPKIFNTDDYNQCESCQSVLSPAAYLVKLLEIVNKYIPNQSLEKRRPDLYGIKLDCDNTNKEKLYLEIVNEIMEEKLKQDLGDDALRKLAAAKYPFNLPANFPLMSIRAYLKKHKTSLVEIYKILIENADTDAEFLSLSPEEYEVITSANETEAYLKEVYGIIDGELKNVDKFIEQTGIEHDKLQPLLDSYNKIKGSIILAVTEQTIDEHKKRIIDNLDNQALSFLHRFIRLANKLNWSFAELTQALSEGKIDQEAIKKIAKIKNLQERFKQPLAKIFALYADSLPESVSNKIDNLPEFKAVLSQKNLKDLAATASNYSALQNILEVNSNELTALINYHNDQKVFGEKILKVYKQVLLARLINIPIAELLSQLSIEGINQDNVVEFNDWLTKHAITTEQIRRLINPGSSKQLAEQLYESAKEVKDLQSFYNEVYKCVGNIQPEILDAIYTFTPNPENLQPFLEKLVHNIDVFTTLKFEAKDIASYKSAYGTSEKWSIESIKTLASYKILKASYSTLPEYINWLFEKDYSSEKVTKKMAQLTGWNQGALEAIKEVEIFRSCFDKQDPVNSLMRIKSVMDITGINVKILLKLKDLYNLKASEGWKKYTDTEKDLELITEKDEGYLAREKRDILARYMIHTNPDLKNMRDLYGFLLIDVEMSECSKISPIKAALNSVQLYIHRAMMKIEKDLNIEGFTEEKWKWLSSYREWEASNKIKLYPENYLNPTLRKITTPEYKKLQNTLMQGNINDEGVSDAYMKYFEDFEQVTSLKIVDSCFEKVDEKNTLYVIGRTLAQPYDYYYRTAIFDEENQKILYWTAWGKIEASIPVETVTPIYAFNRLFIFWVQQIEKGKDNEKRIDATINYIFQKPSGSWTAPQKLASDIKVDPVNEAKKLYWKKVAAFYLKEKNGKERRIVIVVGETKFESANPSNLFTLDEDLVASKGKQGSFINNFTYVKDIVELNKEDIVELNKQDILKSNTSAIVGNKVIFFGNRHDSCFTYDNENETFSTNTISVPRGNVEVAVVGKKAIFFGGSTGYKQYSAQVDIYDDKTGGWTTHTASEARIGASVAVVGNKAIFFGGEKSNDQYSAKVDIYDSGKGSWTAHNISVARGNIAVAVVGKKAIFFGGEKSNGQRSAQVDIYDSETGSWTSHTVSVARKFVTAAVVGNKAIFFGGHIKTPSSKIDMYDDKTKKWTSHTASVARYWPAVAVVGKTAIFFGGYTGEGGYFPDIDIYNDKTGEWTTHTTSNARKIATVAVVGNKAIFFGGEKSNGQAQVDIYEDEEIYENWSTHTISNARKDVEAAVAGNKVIFFSSEGNIDIYDNEIGAWKAINTPIKKWNSHIIQGNEVTLIGSKGYGNVLKYLVGDRVQPLSYDVIENSYQLRLGEAQNIFESNITNKEGSAKFLYGNNYSKQLTLLEEFKKSLSQQVINKPGWFIVEGNLKRENIRESFLVLPKNYDLPAISEQSTYKINKYENKLEFEYMTGKAPQKSNFKDMKFSFIRLNITGNVRYLRQKAYAGGPKSILTLKSQKIEQLPFLRFNPTNSISSHPSDLLDFSGAYGLYLWEIFFHIPMLVAWHLHKEQDFATARKWYQYIFNPTDEKAWQFLPFEKYNTNNIGENNKAWQLSSCEKRKDDHIVASLNDTQINTELALDPFDPYTIAKQRTTAFAKYIIISYIDNLIDWGDMLFAKGSWEALNQATMLYIRAWDLLGCRPIKKGNFVIQPKSFNELKQHDLLQLETDLPAGSQPEVQSDEAHDLTKYSNYFCTPENKNFIGLWDKVEDRLYKIRHCLDMGGKKAVPPLFQPPLNPKQLSAVTGGHSVELPQIQLPHYRFSQMVSYAKSIVETVMQFGSELLDVLEKRDAESLTVLYNKQEGIISNLISSVKEKTIEALKKEQNALNASLNSAEERRSHYENLINSGTFNVFQIIGDLLSGRLLTGLSFLESTGVNLYAKAIATRLGASGIFGIAVPSHWTPTIFGFSNGGFHPGFSLEAGADSATTIADSMRESAELCNIMANYQRRAEDWDLQKKLAAYDVKQINSTIEGNQINQAIAEQELKVHKESIKQNQEKREFFESKFTSKELYDWMKGQIAVIYFQAYKMALEMVKQVEKTYQYELNNDRVFVTASSWNSLKEGLLAGHSLKFALEQMNKEYLDSNERALEITKTIPLSPIEINELKTKGSCKFALTEKMFDLDFPGHYCRKIKNMRITVVAEVAPHEDIHAILQQTGNRVVLKPDIEAIKSLLGESDESNESIRVNWKTGQQIAISKGNQENSGLFELNFNDERYLPFEGTGAVSDWILELPNAEKVSDVIIHLDYTAFNGGKELSNKVKALPKLKYYYDMLAIKLSELDKKEWQRFKQSSELKFKPTFPAEIKNPEIDLSYNGIYLIPKISDESQVDIKLGNNTWDKDTHKVTVTQLENDWVIKATNADKIEEIMVIIPYKAEVNWK